LQARILDLEASPISFLSVAAWMAKKTTLECRLRLKNRVERAIGEAHKDPSLGQAII